MKLDKKQQDIVLSKLQSYGFNSRKCEICGTSDWTIDSAVWQLSNSLTPFLPGINALAIPLISVTCSKCGNTYFFNGINLGVIDIPQKNTLNNDDTK